MDQKKNISKSTENITNHYKKWKIYKKPKLKKIFLGRGHNYAELDSTNDRARRFSTSLIEGSSDAEEKIVESLENLQSNKSTSCESIFAESSRTMGSREDHKNSHQTNTRDQCGVFTRNTQTSVASSGQPFQRRKVVPLRRYRESAIDVPRDFEEAAYAKRVSLPISKRRTRFNYQGKLQEDWPKIDEEVSESETYQIPVEVHFPRDSLVNPFQVSLNAPSSRLASSVENLWAMGNVKAKNRTVLGRSADATSVPELRSSREETNFIRVKSCESPRDQLEILPERDDEKTATALQNNQRPSVASALYSNTEHSSTIDLNSILHRNSEFFITKSSSSKNFLYSSVDKLDRIESINDNLATNVNKLNFNKNTFFLKKLNNSAVAPVESSTTKTFHKVNLRPLKSGESSRRNCESLKSRFSGSFQNLFRLSDFKLRKRCFSEMNLSSKSINRDPSVSFFCPTMIFRSEDSQSSSKPKPWKKYLTLGILKKKGAKTQ
ncbi:hypothetical protein DMENIID0001_088890 [Sergentomyia squamirostris]